MRAYEDRVWIHELIGTAWKQRAASCTRSVVSAKCHLHLLALMKYQSWDCFIELDVCSPVDNASGEWPHM